MAGVPTLHLRDVPDAVYESLKRRAGRNRRSMNAEAVAILQETLDAERDYDDILERLRGLRFTIPEGAPSPEEVIRQARNARHPGYP